MKRYQFFEELVQQHDQFTFERPDELEQGELCAYARSFASWVKQTCQSALNPPSALSINQAMLLLLKKYFEWRDAVPHAHRNRAGNTGHVCVYHIFDRGYHRLRVAELVLTPPILVQPPQP